MIGEKTGRKALNWTERFKGDKVILMIALLLMLISVISVFSSTPLLALETKTDRISIMASQLKVMGFGVIIIALLYIFGRSKAYRWVGKYSFIVCLGMLLVLVLNLHLGIIEAGSINGARRIIKVFGKQLHVYEFVKVLMILYLAWALDTYKEGGFKLTRLLSGRFPRLAFLEKPLWQKIVYIYLPIVITTGCVMMGSNSSGLFVALVMILVIMVGGIDIKDIAIVGGILGILVVGLYISYKQGWLKGSRIETAISRITNDDEDTMQVLLDSKPGSREYNDARDKLRQPVGAQLAIKEGGFFGKGIGNSTQKYTVPVIFGDYMFSFLIEETGIVGALFIILLYYSLLARGTMVAKDCDQYFDKLVTVGLTILVTGQAFMHMAVNVHFPLVPQTGQTLPLVSHGTTSFIVFSLVFGILLSVSRQSWLKMQDREKNVAPILVHHDEVQASLSDVEMMDDVQEEPVETEEESL